jgi:DNA-directed RNA polymerase specialized sigma24 family protein
MRLVRHAYVLTGNISDAQTIAQESFARAWRRWDSVREFNAPQAGASYVASTKTLAATRIN